MHTFISLLTLPLLNLILVILAIVTTTIVVIATDIAMVLAIVRISLIIINLLLSLLPFLLLLLSIHNQLILFHLYLQMHIIFTEWAVLVAKKRCALHPLSVSPFRPAARLITSKVTQRNQKLFGVCQDSVIITQRGGIKV